MATAYTVMAPETVDDNASRLFAEAYDLGHDEYKIGSALHDEYIAGAKEAGRLKEAIRHDAALADVARRLVAALDAEHYHDYGGIGWRRALTKPPYVDEDDELATAWAELALLCPPAPAEFGQDGTP